jgi:hypothetical protein
MPRDDGRGRAAYRAAAKKRSRQSLRLIAVMIATVSVLMVARSMRGDRLALAYAIVDTAPAGADRLYFAFVNYTTLGYGDVTPVARWRLLGPMTAMNGVRRESAAASQIANERKRVVIRDPGLYPPRAPMRSQLCVLIA